MSALFAAQRAEWEANGPEALKRAADLGIVLETYGGNCPVQIEGSFDGLRFYFRARGFGWSFQAAPTDGSGCVLMPTSSQAGVPREVSGGISVRLSAGAGHRQS